MERSAKTGIKRFIKSLFSFMSLFLVLAHIGVECTADEVDDGMSEARRLHIPPMEIKRRVEQLFDFMDIDKDGELSEEEIRDVLTIMFRKTREYQAAKELKLMDTDNDGYIFVDELIDSLKQTTATGEISDAMIDDIKARYAIADRNKDGKLDTGETLPMIDATYLPEMVEFDANEILSHHDTNGDSLIAYEEYFETEKAGGEDLTQVKGDFELFDTNRDNFIDKQEIIDLIKNAAQNDITYSVKELLSMDDSRESLTKKDFLINYTRISKHRLTDSGRLLVAPSRYSLGVPFNDYVTENGETESVGSVSEEGDLEHDEL